MPIHPRKTFGAVLRSDLPGLRIRSDDLFLSNSDRIRVLGRFCPMHPHKGPERLDKDIVHDKLLELMEACHEERDAMWMRSRMEPRLWDRVHARTSWAHGNIEYPVLRTLALGLAQGAWAHYKDPKRSKAGIIQPSCKLAIAALRFADDIGQYESHLKQPDDDKDRDFSEFRGPVYLNGKRLIGPKRKPVTQPVFPIYRFDAAIVSSDKLSETYFETQHEPKAFKSLKRV